MREKERNESGFHGKVHTHPHTPPGEKRKGKRGNVRGIVVTSQSPPKSQVKTQALRNFESTG